MNTYEILGYSYAAHSVCHRGMESEARSEGHGARGTVCLMFHSLTHTQSCSEKRGGSVVWRGAAGAERRGGRGEARRARWERAGAERRERARWERAGAERRGGRGGSERARRGASGRGGSERARRGAAGADAERRPTQWGVVCDVCQAATRQFWRWVMCCERHNAISP
jgi:hypothetical protein